VDNSFKSKHKKNVFRHFKLFILSFICILIFLNTGIYKLWFKERIIGYWDEFLEQKNELDIQARLVYRFGNNYTISKAIASFFEQKKIHDPLILLPPTEYFETNHIPYHVPEPAVFYYYTGTKTIWVDSKEAVKAKWYVRANDGFLFIDSITSTKQFDTIITHFKKYNISL